MFRLFSLTIFTIFTSFSAEAYLQRDLKSALDSFIDQIDIPSNCQVGISLTHLDDIGNELDFAGFQPDHLIYTASISKLLILLAVAHEVSMNRFSFDDSISKINKNEKNIGDKKVKSALREMIYSSSNYYAGVSQRLLINDGMNGKKRTGEIIAKYGFGKGIFWVGKGYKNGRSYPGVSGYNHEGTSRAITAFYKQLMFNGFFSNDEKGDIANKMMRKIMTGSRITNRFYGALLDIGFKQKNILRKSGSWSGNGSYSDSIGITLENKTKMILVLLTQGKSCIQNGSKNWHQLLINNIFVNHKNNDDH